jgi:signal transduction histidine kinase
MSAVVSGGTATLPRESPPNGKPAVLVVDSDPSTVVAIRGLLEPLDCSLVCIGSGIEAVVRARAENFAAIVMDIRLPGLDGYAAASFIRQHPRSASTPILFFSGEDVDVVHLTRQYGQTGQVDSLRKPFDPEIFRARISGWLDLFRKDHQVHELEHAVDAAQAAARSKDEVLMMVAHDLRGPLGALKLSTESLDRSLATGPQRPEFAESVRRHVAFAHRTIDRMARMVGDLLDSVRIESTGLRLEMAVHSLNDVIAQAIELLAPVAEEKHVTLDIAERARDSALRCDRDRILQVLSNLLGNAVKFTPEGGQVHVETTCFDEEVEVCVRDSGPGIAPEQLPYIFDKYWQGNREAGRKGFGLGLSIAQEIVVVHGGRMWVESRLGEGSRFFFSIPRGG